MSLLFLSVLLSALATAGGSCSPGFTVVSFTTFTATPSSPAVCALTTNEEVTTVNGQTLENCANTCAFNQSCAGFNHKNSDATACDQFAGLPTMFTHNSLCTYYEVFSNCDRANIVSLQTCLQIQFDCRLNTLRVRHY